MVPTWGAEQAKDKSETCAIILSRASSAALFMRCANTVTPVGFKVLTGSPRLQKTFLLCYLRNFLLVFVFSIFLLLLYKTFPTGTPHPLTVFSRLYKIETHLQVLSQDV